MVCLSSRPPTHGDYSDKRFGGITVYSDQSVSIDDEVSVALDLIRVQAERQSSTISNYLFSNCKTDLNNDKRLFQALLNRLACTGQVEYVRCLSANGKVFRLIVPALRLSEFRQQVLFAIKLVPNRQEISVRELQDHFFPAREKGTWFVAQNILQRAAYLGFVKQSDKWSFQVPKELSDALTTPHWKLLSPDEDRLA